MKYKNSIIEPATCSTRYLKSYHRDLSAFLSDPNAAIGTRDFRLLDMIERELARREGASRK